MELQASRIPSYELPKNVGYKKRKNLLPEPRIMRALRGPGGLLCRGLLLQNIMYIIRIEIKVQVPIISKITTFKNPMSAKKQQSW